MKGTIRPCTHNENFHRGSTQKRRIAPAEQLISPQMLSQMVRFCSGGEQAYHTVSPGQGDGNKSPLSFLGSE